MEHLGNFNLFTSHFIMGCDLGKYNELETKKALHSWLEYKDTDFAMEGFRVKNTQYVAFLHDIDIPSFKSYLDNLVLIYKNDFPNAKKEDFLNYTFGYSLYYLKQFISRDYRFIISPANTSTFDFFCYYHKIDREYLDYAIPNNKTIEHFKQLYKRLIKVINNVEFEDVALTSSENTNELSSIEQDCFTGIEWASIFYYTYKQSNPTNQKFDKKVMEDFMKMNNIGNSFNYLKKKYYEFQKLINDESKYPIKILEDITPFLVENYPETVTDVKQELNFFRTESTDS